MENSTFPLPSYNIIIPFARLQLSCLLVWTYRRHRGNLHRFTKPQTSSLIHVSRIKVHESRNASSDDPIFNFVFCKAWNEQTTEILSWFLSLQKYSLLILFDNKVDIGFFLFCVFLDKCCTDLLKNNMILFFLIRYLSIKFNPLLHIKYI